MQWSRALIKSKNEVLKNKRNEAACLEAKLLWTMWRTSLRDEHVRPSEEPGTHIAEGEDQVKVKQKDSSFPTAKMIFSF